MSWNGTLMAMAVASHNPRLAAGDPDVLEIGDAEQAAIRGVIRSQIAALRMNDAARAFELCSGGIRETFGSAERLMALIKQRYPALAQPRTLVFGDWLLTPDGVGHVVWLSGPDAPAERAIFLVVQEAGAWRVNGALLAPESAEDRLAA